MGGLMRCTSAAQRGTTMKKLLLAAVLLAGTALATPASAAPVDLGFGILPNPVPQSTSAPCIICATTQAHNPTIGGVLFGYNNFNSQGNDDTFNLFSARLTGAYGNNVETTDMAYTRGFLRSFFESAPINDFNLTFGVAVDINTAHNNEHLDFFQLIDLGTPGNLTATVLFNLQNRDMPVVDNGNGKADYLISGFNLSGIPDDHLLIFRAQWSGASDGGESFYLVPIVTQVPIPPALALFAAGLVGLGMIRQRKKKTFNVA
jgi:hypothetical protein